MDADGKLKRLTGDYVRKCFEWLDENQCGCCSHWIGTTGGCSMYYAVCIGWHHDWDEWKIAWKIGRQPGNSALQCDFDVDFEMPYGESGDVDDTLEVIEIRATRKRNGRHGTAPVGYRSWDALASRMRAKARRVWRQWAKEEGK